MKSYQDIFPEAHLPVMTLDVARRGGQIPKGSYRYLEYFCTEPGCDCRRVTVIVVNEKLRPKAAIGFGFDGAGPFAGPYLDPSRYQSPYAAQLLEFFVFSLNSRPDWLTGMYQQYREVRELFDQGRYRGSPFPAPGLMRYHPAPAPDLAALLEQSLRRSERFCKHTAPAAGAKPKKGRRPGKTAQDGATPAEAKGMARLVELYTKAGSCAPLGMLLALQNELQHHLCATPGAGEEFAFLLPELCRHSADDDGTFDAALRLLYDALDYYQVAVEGERPGAKQQMQRFQSALVTRVFLEDPDPDLCVAVAGIFANSRVKMIPPLEQALGRSRGSFSARGSEEPPAEDLLSVMAGTLRDKGIFSPFDAAREVLGFIENNEPELRIPLVGALVAGEDPFLRETSALLLFNHDPRFSCEVSRMLAAVEGRRIAPETLRRLIISRNWFPEEIRKNVDRAIGNARRARVECAPMSVPPVYSVYVSSREGSGASGFKVVVPDGTACTLCSLVIKPHHGVADCSVTTLRSCRELDTLLTGRKGEGAWNESSPEHLDLSLCQALADSLARGIPPGWWLLRTAEVLGRDRWRGVAAAPFLLRSP